MQIYIGRRAGTELINDIHNAKEEIKIVSPYLSPSYTKELVRLQKKGVDITLITFDKIKEGENFAVTDIIKQKKIINKKAEKTRSRWMLYSILTFFSPAHI